MEEPHDASSANSLGLDFGAIGETESIFKIAWRLAWTKYKTWAIALVAVGIPLFFLHPSLPFVLIVVSFGILMGVVHEWLMREFARANNFTYTRIAPMESVAGKLFRIGEKYSRGIRNVVSGMFAAQPMRLFNYSYSIGTGKEKRTFEFTVVELAFEKTVFPYILLQSRTMSKFSSFDFTGPREMQFPLEPEFADTFKLYATEGYETEVMQIFSPGTLQFLKEKGVNYSIEFAEDRMYVYDDKTAQNKRDLYGLFDMSRAIFDLVGPLLNRLHDDFAALHPYYKMENRNR